MAKPKGGYYAVHTGRVPGIYLTWAECEAQVKGFANAKYKKFSTEEEAGEYLKTLHKSENASSSAAGKKRPSESANEGPSPKKAKLVLDQQPEKEGDIVVYCDGASKGNGTDGAIAGLGVWWGRSDERNLAERCPGEQTNNRAELIAIARILETTPVDKTRRLIIKTDSKYSMDCFHNWIQKWRENGWKNSSGQDVKNAPLIRYIATLLEFRVRLGQKVMLQKVKGHAGIEGNEGADYLANMGTLITTHPPDRDWDEEERQYRENYEKMLSGAQENERYVEGELEVTEEKDDAENGPTEKVSVVANSEALKAIHDNVQEKPADVAADVSSTSWKASENEFTVSEEELKGYAEAWADEDQLDESGEVTGPKAVSTAAQKGSTASEEKGPSEPKSSSACSATPANVTISEEDLAAYADGLADEDELWNDLKD
ncbi:hypothetical protein VNI00_002296 [Paramarasmius palmivorus]|uniref:Ribonuclease H n=1 Tax=Paramarasmius palmivorus TaxID=297713 RepID=A0AAW0E4K0_9AGAR